MKDSFGRNINYLRISITDRCNLRCKYCMPSHGIYKCNHNDLLSLEEIQLIAKEFVELGIEKIRITGGEPLIRKGITKLISNISKLDGLRDISMTTNGLLLERYAEDLKNSGLNRVNISLDTLNKEKYQMITRGGDLEKVFKGIKKAKEVGLSPIKINTVLIGGFNDDEIENFVYLTSKENIDVRFIELMPIGEASNWANENFISSDEVLNRVKILEKVKEYDLSSPAVYYKLPGGKGRVGIINPISCKFCEYCNRIRLTSQGKLKLCLHSNREIDLKHAIRNGESINNIILNSISEKPESHHLEDGKYILKNMNQIGG
ncbi:GTP 3',8-cyclase MoaA [Senegalia massiliensis]|uniref:GTP 3',8-cyclase n=1 Tax=Senegalia massiliensis TaxID=1720316 RepID=A0A845QXV1_9CLOT|nr:GTP 3',8-cyclase MoaA [Senegalia massiliensis]NBI05968.1 GTP 3',8-cyclase MoaA [Senegalia massiliensis]